MPTSQFNIDKLHKGCERLAIKIDPRKQASLQRHLELLAKWNKRLNLTAIDSNDEMISHHLLDSLSIQHYLKGNSLLDVGSGGGFPGLPLAIVNPQLSVTLLDSRGKRVEFLRHCKVNMGLDNVSLVNSRIEDYRPTEKFDTLSARAFSSLAELVRLTKHFQSDGTRLLALKGKRPDEEIETLQQLYGDDLTGRLFVERLEVPYVNAQRHIVVIDF